MSQEVELRKELKTEIRENKILLACLTHIFKKARVNQVAHRCVIEALNEVVEGKTSLILDEVEFDNFDDFRFDCEVHNDINYLYSLCDED